MDKNKPTALDTVGPADIRRFSKTTELMLKNLSGELVAVGDVKESTVETMVGRIMDDLPTDIRREITDIEGMRAQLTTTINKFVAKFKKKEPIEKDLKDLVGQLLEVFLSHHLFALVHNPALDDDQFAKNFDPLIRETYPSIAMQKLLGFVIWIASFVTSWMGATHYLGKGIAAAQSTFGFTLPPMVSIAIRHLASIWTSGKVSDIVQDFKADLEKHANKEDEGLPTTFLVTMRKRFKGSALVAALAGVVALLDVATNFNGIMTIAGTRAEVTDQIGDARTKIGERTKAIAAQIKEYEKVPGEIGRQADQAVAAESSGASETGSAGRGPVFRAKSLLYNEDQESRGALDATDLGKQLHAAIESAGVLDSVPLSEEVDERVRANLAKVEGLIAEIDAATAKLDPGQEIEFLNQSLDAIVQQIEEAVQVLNKDLPEDVGGHLDKYNSLNRTLVQIAQRSGKYPNMKPDEMKSWKLPDLSIDTSKIEVEDFEYIGFEDLMDVMRRQFTGPQSALLLLLAAVFSIMSSYADLLTLRWTRAAYKEDEKSRQQKNKFIEHYKAKMVALATKALNSGPFSWQFKPGTKVDERYVREMLDHLIKSRTSRSRDHRRYKMTGFASKIMPIPPMPGVAYPTDEFNHTEVALAHNASVHALHQIMSTPSGILAFVREVLPGLPFTHEATQGGIDMTRRHNDAHITKKNEALQRADVEALVHDYGDLNSKIKPSIEVAAWEMLVHTSNTLAFRAQELEPQLYDGNRHLFGEIDPKATRERIDQILPEVVSHALAGKKDLSENLPDSELQGLEAQARRLDKVLKTVKPLDEDHRQEIADAHTALSNRIARIHEIREIKARDRRQVERKKTVQYRAEQARDALYKLRAWRDLGNASSNHFVRSNNLCELLGEVDLLPSLNISTGQKIALDLQDDLRRQYEEFCHHLDFLEAELTNAHPVNRAYVDEILFLRRSLEEDWDTLEYRFF